MRIFSGIQPTGDKHLGNLQRRLPPVRGDAGAGRGASSASSTCTRSPSSYDPDELRDVDARPRARCSSRPGSTPTARPSSCRATSRAHAEAAWLLSAVTSYGQLGRMTAVQGEGRARRSSSPPASSPIPVLMAGDILLYQTDIVPIGDDQRQHLELARDVAERFNSPLRRDVRRARGPCPRTRRADHGPARSRAEDVDDGAARRRDGPDRRHAGHDPQEDRRAPSPTRARDVRYDRLTSRASRTCIEDHVRRDRRADRRARGARYDGGGYGQFKADVAEAVVAHCSIRFDRAEELRPTSGAPRPCSPAALTQGASLSAHARADGTSEWAFVRAPNSPLRPRLRTIHRSDLHGLPFSPQRRRLPGHRGGEHE